MEFAVYALENLHTKVKYLDAEKQVGNIDWVKKGGILNGYDGSYRRFANTY